MKYETLIALIVVAIIVEAVFLGVSWVIASLIGANVWLVWVLWNAFGVVNAVWRKVRHG